MDSGRVIHVSCKEEEIVSDVLEKRWRIFERSRIYLVETKVDTLDQFIRR